MRIFAILVLCTGLVAQSSDCSDILNQYTDENTYWYGIGTSKIKRFRSNQAVESASKQALDNLSSKLNTLVESTALITTNESIGVKRAQFIQQASSTIRTTTSQNISDYSTVYSSPCSKNQFMTVVALKKQTYFENQEQKVRGILIQTAKMLEGVDSFQNRLDKLNEFYVKLINVGRIEGIDTKLSNQYSQALGKIVTEYDLLMSDVLVELTLSEPLMAHINNHPNIILMVRQKSSSQPIAGIRIDSEYFGQQTTNQEGIVSIPWKDNLKNKLPFTVQAQVLINELVSNHNLYDSTIFSNPISSLTVQETPLQLSINYQIEDPFLLERANDLSDVMFQSIFSKLSAELVENVSPFEIEIQYRKLNRSSNLITSAENPIEIYKVEFNPVIILKKTSNNTNLLVKDLGTVKATSYRSFENAYQQAIKTLPIIFQQTGEEIVEAIL